MVNEIWKVLIIHSFRSHDRYWELHTPRSLATTAEQEKFWRKAILAFSTPLIGLCRIVTISLGWPSRSWLASNPVSSVTSGNISSRWSGCVGRVVQAVLYTGEREAASLRGNRLLLLRVLLRADVE
eukprot:4334678-Prymnesium_polylepis.1